MILRDYQEAAVTQVLEHLSVRAPRVLLVSPTGSGKTVTASEIIKRLDRPLLFLVHRRELLQQAVNTLSRFNIPTGVIMAGVTPRPEHKVQIASIQTLARRDVPASAVIMIDEAHHVTKDNSYGKLLEQLPTAQAVGLTATPWRLDGKGLADLFPVYVSTRSPRQLKEEGHLVPCTGWVFRPIDASAVTTRGGDYVESQLARVELPATIVGDVVTEWLARSHRERTILFACGVEHSKRFVAAFNAAGVPAEHVDGSTPKSERAAILERVRLGVTLVLSNCSVATEGFDLPELSCVILARPTRSDALYLQMVGRVLRPAPGKVSARILDHAGCVEEHGLPYDDRDYSPRANKVKRDPNTLPLTQCHQCGVYLDTWPCSECGAEKPLVNRSSPLINPNAEAVAIEALEADPRSSRGGQVRFRRVGEVITATYVRREPTQGDFGPIERLHFEGRGGSKFWIDPPTDLESKVPHTQGALVRMTYTGDSDLSNGRRKKLFRVQVRRDA